jgi:hypothetical protein
MTSPVAMSRRFYDDDVLVPKKFKKETLPQPSQSQIEFREEPKLLLPYPLAGLVIRK